MPLILDVVLAPVAIVIRVVEMLGWGQPGQPSDATGNRLVLFVMVVIFVLAATVISVVTSVAIRGVIFVIITLIIEMKI